MEKNSRCREDFVLESSSGKHDDVVDENDNYSYKYVEQTNDRQLVDLDVDETPFKIIRIESIPDSVFASDVSHKSRQRQTTLSEYFSELPTETSTVDLERDDFPEKMVNVSLLLRQLQSARVVLNRLPDKPVKIPIPTGLPICQIGVQRYCHNCKTLDIDRNRLMTPKICSKCRTALLYVCDKCNERHYHSYACLTRHRSLCKGDKTGKSLNDVDVLYCAECPFKTSYRIIMANHAKSTGHKVLDGQRQVADQTVMEVYVKNQGKPVRLSSYQLKFLVEHNDIDYSIAKKRYCPKCAKIVDNRSSNDGESCNICDTTLLFQCGKCDHRCVHYNTLLYHLKAKCYPSVYRCPKCEYTASIWDCMSRHLKKPCRRSLMKHYKMKTKFTCEHCSFGTVSKWYLKIHLGKVHEELFAWF